MGSPPLTRGILVYRRDDGKMLGITPAYAGNTCFCTDHMCSLKDHPRLRGEYLLFVATAALPKGSPPLTRGIRHWTHGPNGNDRITPAYAGNTIIAIFFHDTARDHPRLRGEYKNERTEPGAGTGSPPLTRGILPFSFRTPAIVGITPAYAGNTV